MDHADDGGDDDVFIYMGGDQEVPLDVTRVRVHKSVKIIRQRAFFMCTNLVSIEMHDGVEIIEPEAFYDCESLRGIKLQSVRVIGAGAFYNCTELADIEFGDKLETIGMAAFTATNRRNMKLSKIRVIGSYAFQKCQQLTDAELSEDLETIENEAFWRCPRLRRIAMPLKDNLLVGNVFYGCGDLSKVDLVGGVHKTISSLLLESWKNEMNNEIDRINQQLPNSLANAKTATIRQWMGVVLDRIEHFKLEHYAFLKEDMTQLELALWKANLHEEEEEKEPEEQPTKKAKFDEECEKASTEKDAVDTNLQNVETARQRARVTCGANLIIPHVLSFLNDEGVFPTQNHNS